MTAPGADARAVKAYAGAAPVTRASGKSRAVNHRRIKNQRLASTGYLWAFSTLTGSAGESVGDSYDNAMAESVIGLLKTELIRRKGPWRGLDAVELATLEWVDWYNNRRLFEALETSPRPKPKPTTTAQPRHLKTCRWQNPASTESGVVQPDPPIQPLDRIGDEILPQRAAEGR